MFVNLLYINNGLRYHCNKAVDKIHNAVWKYHINLPKNDKFTEVHRKAYQRRLPKISESERAVIQVHDISSHSAREEWELIMSLILCHLLD